MSKYIQGETFFVVLMMVALAYVYIFLIIWSKGNDEIGIESKLYTLYSFLNILNDMVYCWD